MQDIQEIGVVRNDMPEPMDPHEMRQEESVIEIHERYADGLYRIEDNRYIQVVFPFIAPRATSSGGRHIAAR